MNFKLSSFLSGSLRVLNITNKTLPLIKEVKPVLNNIKEKYIKNTIKRTNTIPELPYKDKQIKKEDHHNNNFPIFFR